MLNGPILVSGGHGFIGRRLVLEAEARRIAMVAPSRAELDWTDAAAVRAAIQEADPAAIVHLASPGVSAADPDDPALIAVETAMMRNILEAAPEGCRVVGGGSMAEYGQSGRLAETTACTPGNAYARAKYQAGKVLIARLEAGGITGCHARIFGAYGPSEAPRRLFPAVLAQLRNGEPAPVSDGRQLRDFVHVDDIARVLLDLVAAPTLSFPIVNIGTGYALSVRAVLERLADEIGVPCDLLRFGALPRSPHDRDMLEADVERLRRTIGWVPQQRWALPGAMLPWLDGAPDTP